MTLHKNTILIDFPECNHLELLTKAAQKFRDAITGFLAACDG
ncbi:MAG TPA: hypothetical protein VFH95_15075 [Candidatus Kapabacteria bacterium]|nr:hypothetical protein [Candidatus Kapabacteria bacterium]